jgi:tetrathionate reductase subunit B
MELLLGQAPQELPEANLRRKMLAQMITPAMKQIKNIGIAGLAGSLLVKSMQDEDEE